ncbi:MAG: outer membrane lipoprotein-sorting protein [Candidatus Protistobacter heckmanni]|nr:outer membrane lipoprotein-sorting protein [Candidatus Protistobacter heckmanni]
MRTFKNAVMAAGLTMVTVLPAAQAAEPDAMQLLKRSDQARGGGYAGLVWEIQVTNTGSGAEDQPNQKLCIKAVDTASVAEVLDPPNTKGSCMLQVDRNMWMTKHGLKKPVAIGDIAATNYAKDYSAKYLRQEDVGGEPCHVLDLSVNNRQTTYDRITYWVLAKRGLAVKAEFLSLSCKKLKSADFEYGNSIVANGKTIPFVSKMTIADALTDARTTLQYTRIKVQAVPASEFDVGNLQ